MDYVILAFVGYLIGSVPFGLIAGRVFKGVDVRELGSGMTGMTNVLRTVGMWAAVLVLLLDMGKSVLAVVLARVFSDSQGAEAAAALATILGHNWPIFVGFRGGRGTSPAWGGLIVLSPVSGLVASIVGVTTVAVSRYVSLGSIVGACTGAAVLVALSVAGFAPLAYAWYGIIGAPLVVVRHRDNIGRLMRGQERRLGKPAGKGRTERKTTRGKGLRWPRLV